MIWGRTISTPAPQGLEIAENGVRLVYGDNGRMTGEAFVEFTTQEVCGSGAGV